VKSKRKASASQKMLVTTVARSREEERPHFLASQDPQGKGTWADWLAAICKGHVHTLRSRRLGGMRFRQNARKGKTIQVRGNPNNDSRLFIDCAELHVEQRAR
jgi:hypothetical protein